jgi:hypothetical protein
MTSPEDKWYQIVKNCIGLKDAPIPIDEVQGESRACKRLETLDATLSAEERKAGWKFFLRPGGVAPKTGSQPRRKKSVGGGRRAARPDRQNRR